MNLDKFKFRHGGPDAGRQERRDDSLPEGCVRDGVADAGTFRMALVHELRAPLQVLQGHLDALWDDADPMRLPGPRKRLGTMRSMLDVLSGAVDDVLQLGRGEIAHLPLREAVFEVRECLDAEVDAFAGTAQGKGLDLTCDIADDVPVVMWGDASRLRQILRTLLDNALKYTAFGGVAVRVSWASDEDVEAAGHDRGDHRDRSGRLDGNGDSGDRGDELDDAAGAGPGSTPRGRGVGAGRLTIRVTDTGPGIPAGMENAVFAAFARADQSVSGTGLGLWIAQQWAQRLGGALDVESSTAGARFRLSVPFSMPGEIAGELAEGMPDKTLEKTPGGVRGQAGAEMRGEKSREIPREISQETSLEAQRGPASPLADRQRVADARRLPSPHELSASTAPARSLPVTPVPVAQIAVRPGLQVLVVDDHLMNRKILVDQLASLGCHTASAGDLVDALVQWVALDVDVVLTDVHLGGACGLTLAKTLRALAPALGRRAPVIFAVTGSVVEARTAQEAGIDGVLTKPVSRQRLSRTLAVRWPFEDLGQEGQEGQETQETQETHETHETHETQERPAGQDACVAHWADEAHAKGAGPAVGHGPSATSRPPLKDDPRARKMMREEMAKDLARFRRLIAGRRAEDFDAAQMVLHRMRGACRMFGDPVLTARCERLSERLAQCRIGPLPIRIRPHSSDSGDPDEPGDQGDQT